MPSVLDNTASWLPRRAAWAGERVALIDPEHSLGYRELDERAARAATWLWARGVRRGDRVAVIAPNGTPYLEVAFGAMRLGAIALPINTRLAPPEVRELLDDAEPRVVLREPDLAADAWEKSLSEVEPHAAIEPASPDDPNILMYTSGTTGSPKGALLPHRKTLYNSLNAQLFFGLRSDDRVLVVLPLFHSFGLQILTLPALYAGAAVVLERHFDPEAIWEAVAARDITFFGGVPTMFRALLEALESAPADRWDLSSLRFAFTAGAAIPVELIHGFRARGIVLKQGFGQTETSILTCLDAEDAVRKAGSVGRPVFHADVRVVDVATLAGHPDTWRVVVPGEEGEIVVRGPITMTGYWRRPEETAETLREDGWLRTGDLATVDDEGFLTLVGRARDLYISGGENVYPMQVERVFEEHPAVREMAIVGIPDEKWGEVGRAYVVLEEGAALDADALRAWGRERLASFKIPREFVPIDALPRTPSGKVQKHRLGR